MSDSDTATGVPGSLEKAVSVERMADWVLTMAGDEITQEQAGVLAAEIRRLRAQVTGHAERIAAQSQLLTRWAEAWPALAKTGPLVWTKEPPTVPGWYWCQRPGHYIEIRELRPDQLGRTDLVGASWAGPLVLPG